MDKPKHTPGPWHSAAEVQQLDLGESIEVFAGTVEKPGAIIAMVMNADDFPCLEEPNAEDFDIEAQANARLIAASPALYEALKLWIDKARFFSPDSIEYHMAWDQATAALALVESEVA